MQKKQIENIKKVYNFLKTGAPVTVKFTAESLGLNVSTVREARNFLIDHNYLRVSHFSVGGTIVYEPTTENYAHIFGTVSSFTDHTFTQTVEIDAYSYDVDGTTYPVKWKLELDTQIIKDIADYVKSFPAEVPFF